MIKYTGFRDPKMAQYLPQKPIPHGFKALRSGMKLSDGEELIIIVIVGPESSSSSPVREPVSCRVPLPADSTACERDPRSKERSC